MTITFNDFTNLRYLARRNNGTFSSNYNNTVVFDYFVNSPTVNDCLYFTYCKYNPSGGAGTWKDINVTIGTPRTNSGAGIWEYTLAKWSISTASFNTTTNLIGISSHGVLTGDTCEVMSSTGSLPSPLTINTTYYIRKYDDNSFYLHNTLADAQASRNTIDLTTSGGGTMNFTVWRTLTVNDPTNGFTASAGQYTITFTPPNDWAYGYYNCPETTNDCWVRYRLTDITGITEGGANATNYVQCGNYAYRVVGYSSATPASFLDIYNQDQSDGRGLVQKYKNTYMISSNIEIGDGTTDTYFLAYNNNIMVENCIYITGKAYVQLGQKSANGGVYNGCTVSLGTFTPSKTYNTFNIYCAPSSRQYFYSTLFREISYFNTSGDTSTNQTEYIGCTFNCSPLWVGYQTIDRVNIFGNNDGFRFYGVTYTTPNDVLIHKAGAGGASTNWNGNNGIYNTRGFTFKDCSYGHQFYGGSSASNRVMNFYDCIGFDITKCNRGSTVFTNCYANEYYSLNYTILDKQNTPIVGASVIAKNGFGTFSGVTDSSGNISLDVQVKQMKIDDASIIDNSTVMVTISATGFETIKDTQILSKKMVDVCCLARTPFHSRDEMGTTWI